MRFLLLLMCLMAACVSRADSTAHAATEPETGEAEVEMEEYSLFDPAVLQDMVTEAFVERRKQNASESLDGQSFLMERAREAASRVEISDWIELRRVVLMEREVPKDVRARVSSSMV